MKKNPIVQVGCNALSTQRNTFDSDQLDVKRKCHQPPWYPMSSLGDDKVFSQQKNVK